IGSQITDTSPYLDALDRVLDLVEAIEAEGIATIHHLDVGGGLGITYTDESPPAADVLVMALLARIDARGHGHREILFDPGRSHRRAVGRRLRHGDGEPLQHAAARRRGDGRWRPGLAHSRTRRGARPLRA